MVSEATHLIRWSTVSSRQPKLHKTCVCTKVQTSIAKPRATCPQPLTSKFQLSRDPECSRSRPLTSALRRIRGRLSPPSCLRRSTGRPGKATFIIVNICCHCHHFLTPALNRLRPACSRFQLLVFFVYTRTHLEAEHERLHNHGWLRSSTSTVL